MTNLYTSIVTFSEEFSVVDKSIWHHIKRCVVYSAKVEILATPSSDITSSSFIQMKVKSVLYKSTRNSDTLSSFISSTHIIIFM
uniref:Putative ovule protein n=1 Tax=Solanum chacoense TaxID=4108 RepID=A0A0V0I6P3_SOLCH